MIKIGNKLIREGKTFVVAEMSGNHNGKLSRALNIIKAAKRAGADAIKLQTYRADTITLNSNKKDFLINNLSKKNQWKKFKTFYNLYEHASTPWEWHKKLFLFAQKLKLEIFSSPFDESAVDFLESLNCPAYKIASPEITHIPLLEKVAKTNKPIIISTGLALEKDIKLAIKAVKNLKNSKIVLLKCNTSYPSPIEEGNLLNIKYLSQKYKTLVGYSDHTKDNISSITAVALGAVFIEKHFNLNDNKKTIDSFFSTKEDEFRNLIASIRKVEKIKGNFKYILSRSSKKNFKGRRSIYVSKEIKKNEIITQKNIKVVRPGTGLHPKFFRKILGRKSRKKLFLGERLSLKHIY
jgi:pseudaminic acid synthase